MQYNPEMDTKSFYIHWPFCPYKCHFCPFVALASHDQFMKQYHDALMKEIESFSDTYKGAREIDTLFFGGGTPSTYPDDLLFDTFTMLKKHFSFSETIEVSIEVNPGTVRKEQLTLWKSLGINRLSIGVQSLKDRVLQQLNRMQSAKQVSSLLQDAPEHISNLSVDLILGLPGVSQKEWKELIEQAVTWPIKHISVYFLTVHEDTPLYFKVTTNRVTLPTDNVMVHLYEWTVQKLAEHGFERYELSNFARSGYESRHNSVYWQRKPYKAFGLGACSFDGKSRFQNEKNLMKYMEGIEKQQEVVSFCETLTSDQIHLERLMLGLRRKVGVTWNDISEHVPIKKKEGIKQALERFKKDQFLQEHNGRYVLTTAGMAVENEIIALLSK